MNKISIRNSKFAIVGLKDMINYIELCSEIDVKDMVMLEIGSYVGDSTRIFAQNFGKVISVDPYLNGYDDRDASSFIYPMEQIYQQFKEDILDIYSNVHHIRKKSLDAVSLFEKPIFDFVYIDGNHRGFAVRQDAEAWLPKIKKGGWIGGHDYNNMKNAPEVKEAVDSLFKIDATFKDTSWIRHLI